jgi:hypothetical protein
LDRKLGGPESWSEHGGEKKNFQPLPGLEPPIIQPVDQRYSTELYRTLIIIVVVVVVVVVAANIAENLSPFKVG